MLIDNQCKLISADGRAKVMSDPTGKWVPAPPAPAPVVPAAAPREAAGAGAPAGGLASVIGKEPLLATDGSSAVSLLEVVKDAPLIGLYLAPTGAGRAAGSPRSW